MKRNKGRYGTLLQQRQQQLAWLLYINEGMLANIEKALRTNIFCLSEADVAAVRVMRTQTELTCAKLRKRLGTTFMIDFEEEKPPSRAAQH